MSACCTLLHQYPLTSHHQICTYLPSRPTHLQRSAPHCSVSTVVHQHTVVDQRTVTWARLVVTLVRKALQVAEPVKSLKGLWARLAVMMAEVDVYRLSSYYSWQYRSLDHRPHTFPHHCTGSPLPCTETDIPPGTHTQWHISYRRTTTTTTTTTTITTNSSSSNNNKNSNNNDNNNNTSCSIQTVLSKFNERTTTLILKICSKSTVIFCMKLPAATL